VLVTMCYRESVINQVFTKENLKGCSKEFYNKEFQKFLYVFQLLNIEPAEELFSNNIYFQIPELERVNNIKILDLLQTHIKFHNADITFAIEKLQKIIPKKTWIAEDVSPKPVQMFNPGYESFFYFANLVLKDCEKSKVIFGKYICQYLELEKKDKYAAFSAFCKMVTYYQN